MNEIFEIIHKGRTLALKLIEPFSFEQLNTIPSGFRNNCLWQIGHMATTTCALTYKLTGHHLPIPNDFVSLFKNGTVPSKEASPDLLEQAKLLLLSSIKQIENDYYHTDTFKSPFQEYKTSYGITLNSIDNAITFSSIHDNIHLGILMCYRKLLKN